MEEFGGGGTHEEQLVRRVAVVPRVEDAVVAEQRVEPEAELGMSLDPATKSGVRTFHDVCLELT